MALPAETANKDSKRLQAGLDESESMLPFAGKQPEGAVVAHVNTQSRKTKVSKSNRPSALGRSHATVVVESTTRRSVVSKSTTIGTATRRDIWQQYAGRRLKTRHHNKPIELTRPSRVTRSTNCTQSGADRRSLS